MMIGQFLNYLRVERNYSLRTINAYGDDLYAFEAYFKNLDSHFSWSSVDSDVIRDWMESMMDKGNTATTVRRRLSALRSFFRFALKSKWIEKDPAYLVQGPKARYLIPSFVKEKDMDRLLDDKMWTDNYYDCLVRTILFLFYCTGIRLSELLELKDSSVDFVNCDLKVLGKRNKQRVIPFGDELRQMLLTYRNKRDIDVGKHSDVFLLDLKGEPLKKAWVEQTVKQQLSRVTTQQKCTPHVLRHTFATAMLNHNAGIEGIKRLLGHAKLSTTEIYTHTTFEQLKKVYKNAHPRA